ncbi:MAG: hypothetical protein WAO85_10275 [Tepidanaerobacteraceae bacterium]
MLSRKTGLKILVVLLVMLLATPSAFAAREAKLIFNGREYKADIILKDGVSYISSSALKRIPGLELGDDPIVPIRKLFESQGGEVSWDNNNWHVIVSWREKSGDFTADELVIKSSELLKEANSYRMKAVNEIGLDLQGDEALKALMGVPINMELVIEGVFRNEPMSMHMKQTMKMPLEMLGVSPEEMEASGLAEGIVTETVWHDNVIYTKNPDTGQWIYQDLTGMEEMIGFDSLIQMTPQQSIEMMNEAGVINVFGDDAVIEGREYYTIKNYIDAESYRSLVEQVLGNINLGSFMAAFAAQAGDGEDVSAQLEQIFDIVLNNIVFDYYIDTFINKETLLSDYMKIDLNMVIDVKQLIEAIAEVTEMDEEEKAAIPESPMVFQINMKGDYQMYDYGVELELPDLSDAISQEEYMQQIMEMMEEVEEAEALAE